MGARDYRELDCWTLADEARRKTTAATQSLRFEGHPRLASQFLRSAVSACANIAEGFARFGPREFAPFLNIAKGSLSELLEHLTAATDLGLVEEDDRAEIASLVRRAMGATTRLIVYLKTANVPGQGPRPPYPNRRRR